MSDNIRRIILFYIWNEDVQNYMIKTNQLKILKSSFVLRMLIISSDLYQTIIKYDKLDILLWLRTKSSNCEDNSNKFKLDSVFLNVKPYSKKDSVSCKKDSKNMYKLEDAIVNAVVNKSKLCLTYLLSISRSSSSSLYNHEYNKYINKLLKYSLGSDDNFFFKSLYEKYCKNITDRHILGLIINIPLLFKMIYLNKIELLKYIHDEGYRWKLDVCLIAIGVENIEFLTYMVNYNFFSNIIWEKMLLAAVSLNKVKSVNFLKDYRINFEYAAICAVEANSLECLKYLHNKNLIDTKSKNLCAISCRYGYLECLKYLIDKSYPIDEELSACNEAFSNTSFILRKLKDYEISRIFTNNDIANTVTDVLKELDKLSGDLNIFSPLCSYVVRINNDYVYKKKLSCFEIAYANGSVWSNKKKNNAFPSSHIGFDNMGLNLNQNSIIQSSSIYWTDFEKKCFRIVDKFDAAMRKYYTNLKKSEMKKI